MSQIVDYLHDIMPLNHYRDSGRSRLTSEKAAQFSPDIYARIPLRMAVINRNMRSPAIRTITAKKGSDIGLVTTSTPLESPTSSYVQKNNNNIHTTPTSKIFSESFISAITTEIELDGTAPSGYSEEGFKNHLDRLYRLAGVQEEQIEQATSAMEQCRKQFRSNGTLAELTAQRALLLASERLRVLNYELQRLNAMQQAAGGSLPPLPRWFPGSMTISTIRIHLNRNFCLKSIDKESSYDFVVLMRSGEHVFATQVACIMDIGPLRARFVRFPDTIRFNNLTADFCICVEIFAMKIENRSGDSKNPCLVPRRALKCLTPTACRPVKISQDSAVNIHEFSRCGHVCLNRETTGSLKFYVDDAEYPLEGTIELRALLQLDE
ncbi:hypothetical protein L596_028417 [Steinernema carpocapsae]|uniref:Anillin homology domain-containing protein n=1 Tax=Steinernema carpocapsae TaxID=34508 RepID=A0A4U5LYD8_STECR|nr:hypothetical protein L596_028417 [Steinernema carpocapsae]